MPMDENFKQFGTRSHEGLEVLSYAECLRLLQMTRLGRVALSVGALPAVFPVHFALLGPDPVFRTDAGTKLSAASAGNVVCLEIDDADTENHAGWSVMVTGPAEVLADPLDLALAHKLPLRPWVGKGDHFVRIRAAEVSGRQVRSPYPGRRSNMKATDS